MGDNPGDRFGRVTYGSATAALGGEKTPSARTVASEAALFVTRRHSSIEDGLMTRAASGRPLIDSARDRRPQGVRTARGRLGPQGYPAVAAGRAPPALGQSPDARALPASRNHCGTLRASASTLTSAARASTDLHSSTRLKSQAARSSLTTPAGSACQTTCSGDHLDEELPPLGRIVHAAPARRRTIRPPLPASPRRRRTLLASATRRPARSPGGRGSSR